MIRLALLLLAVRPAVAAPPPPVVAVAYHPKEAVLAAAAGRDVWLYTKDGTRLSKFETAPDTVTALAWSKDGTKLAFAFGRPGREASVEVLPYTVAVASKPKPFLAHADVILGMEFSPDGSTLATCGYDRLVVLWDVAKREKVHTLKDHSDAVYAVAWHPKGNLLASVSADRAVKVWDAATGKRLYTLGDPTDWVYAVTWNPKGTHLAAAGVDKSIRVWEADAVGGKLVKSAFADTKPVTKLLYSADGKSLYSAGEGKTVKRWDAATLKESLVYPAQPDTILALALREDGAALAVGRYDGTLAVLNEKDGKTLAEPLPVKSATVPETGFNDAPSRGTPAKLPSRLTGTLTKAGEADYFRFWLKAGQEFGARVVGEVAGKFDAVLELTDAVGGVVAEGTGLLGYVAKADGEYALGIRDREYRGGADFEYAIDAGDVPVVTGVFPLGVQRGTDATVRLDGVNLGTAKTATVKVPADAAVGSKIKVPLPALEAGPFGAPSVVVGEFAEVAVEKGMAKIAVPGTANGTITTPGETHLISFAANKGERLIVEVNARRLGSPLDSTHRNPRRGEQAGAAGDAALRGPDVHHLPRPRLGHARHPHGDVERTGRQRLRPRRQRTDARSSELPPNPDDDCQFLRRRRASASATSARRRRTTRQGRPMYKVAIHPPGTDVPAERPAGVDADLPQRRRRPRLRQGFAARLRPAGRRRLSGPRRRLARPGRAAATPIGSPSARRGRDFAMPFRPRRPRGVARAAPCRSASRPTRIDGYDGPIAMTPGEPAARLQRPRDDDPPAEQTSDHVRPVRRRRRDRAAERRAAEARRPARRSTARRWSARRPAALPKVLEPGDIVTTTEQSEVTLKPGGETRVTVKMERRNGFAGRIPLEVRGLPHGVRVLDVGLNGILITDEARRNATFVIYAEPWVAPTEQPFVVLAKREGKNTEHAAPSVLLKVEK